MTRGTSGNAVADLRTGNDGLYYTVTEAATTPGIRLTVHFVSVTKFTRVKIVGHYSGSTSHAVGIQLYDWVNTTWHTYNAFQSGVADFTANEVILDNASFQVTSSLVYIGTGANAGKVDVRFNHTMAGTPNHSMAIDVCALVR